ncbi:uncharacterized protein V1516DRAFT_673995 [Lipomyces oligophaga]|uniref:uncharacterized protein n=1 Tax=Lipomyces oligophaga TaxID=45792 RepID=UPI0034CFFDEF
MTEFVIFGYNIPYTLSPTIHNAGFPAVGLNYRYSIRDVAELDVEETTQFLADKSFGGASVTLPHKLAIIPFLDSLSAAARLIGAVNTIVVKPDPSRKKSHLLLGDNTDYTGIKDCAAEYLVQKYNDPTLANSSALVIGAGGSARAAIYAMSALKAKVVFLYNRTRSTAEKLEADFAAVVPIIVIDSLDPKSWNIPETFLDSLPVKVIVGNVPGDALSDTQVPDGLFTKDSPGVLVEMAYKPPETALIRRASSANWNIVRGTDVLLAQGYQQFRLWTGIEPPKQIMIDALNAEVERRKQL